MSSVSNSESLPAAGDTPFQGYIPLSNPDILGAREHPANLILPQCGVDARYWIYESNAPTTNNLIMIHGFRGDHHGLLPITEYLDHYRVIAVDLPGFGRTEPLAAAKHSVNNYVVFLEEFLDLLRVEKNIDSYTLVGHSFGSIIASHFAARRPHDLEKLVLINPIPAPALKGPQKFLSSLALFYYRLSARLPEKLGLSLLQSPVIIYLMTVLMTKTRDRSLKHFIKDQHRTYFSTFANREVVLEAFESSISETVYTAASRISVPTLLLAGEQDEIAPATSQQKLQEALQAAAVLEIIADVGHLIHYEKPYEAARAIDSFLKRPA